MNCLWNHDWRVHLLKYKNIPIKLIQMMHDILNSTYSDIMQRQEKSKHQLFSQFLCTGNIITITQYEFKSQNHAETVV